MLGKLLKYDLKWTYKVLVIFYCLAFVFSALSFGFGKIENSMLFKVLYQIAYSFAISMLASALINCIMRSWARLVKNVYKDESYLTHTLPVSKNTVYSSKILSAIICTCTTFIVSAICLIICFYDNDNIIQMLKNALELTADTLNSTVISLLLAIFSVAVLEIIFILFVGYAGIIIGHRSNKGKMVKSIVIAFVLYMAANVISVAAIFIIGLIHPNIMNLINTTDTVNADSIKAVMLMAIIVYIIYNIICYFIGKWQLKKGVNVD